MLAFARSKWQPLSTEGGLDLYPFDGGLELRVWEWDKGDAVRAVLADEPEGTAVAYLGDDLTDEDAFRALGELSSSGRVNALCVLVREEARPSLAATRRGRRERCWSSSDAGGRRWVEAPASRAG